MHLLLYFKDGMNHLRKNEFYKNLANKIMSESKKVNMM